MHKIVDYHYHVTPPGYVRIMKELGIEGNTGVRFKKFDPGKNLMLMNKLHICKAMLSISTPGVYVKDDETSGKIARLCNEYISSLMDEYPGRYGGFGALPFPAPEKSLQELEYIYDVLKLDGVAFLSNVQGTYFGEAGYDELFQELDRRRALVFIHPEDLLVYKGPYLAVIPFYERMLDTARSGYNLFLNGYLEKYPRIRYILSHGGGALPVLARRIVREYFGRKKLRPDEQLFTEKLSLLSNLYFDTAQRGPAILSGLKAFCGTGRIVFGSDTPYVPPFEVSMNQKEIAGCGDFTAEEKDRIYAGVAEENQFAGKGVSYEN